MIVGFEQDPNAAFGSGNFRDEAGRITYLHDPDTASDFVPTMPGAKSGGGGGKLAIPDNPPGVPEQAPGGSPGASLVQRNTDAVNKLAGVTPGAAPSTPEPAAPATPAPAPAPTPAPAPPAPAAPPPGAEGPETQAEMAGAAAAGSRGAALVHQNAQAVTNIHGARTRPPAEALPVEVSTNNLPPFRTSFGETATIAEGRPIENIVEGLEETEGAAREADAVIGQSFDARQAASNRSFDSRQAALQRNNEVQAKRQAEARAERVQAEADQARMQKVLQENDNKLDPDRVMRNMSTGKTIAMVILAALNGGFGAVIGKKDNDVLNVMQRAVDQDIDRQKEEIKNGHVRTQNLIDKFMKQGFDAKTSEFFARDQIDKNLLAFGDLEAQRVQASADLQAQKDMLLAQRHEAMIIRRDQELQKGENRITRARNSEESYGVPPVVPGVTPQDQLASLNLGERKKEVANTKFYEDALGHPVSADEAKRLEQDKQDFAARSGQNRETLNRIFDLATAMGLTQDDKGQWIGNADPGVRPGGTEVFSEQARSVTNKYTLLKEAKVYGAPREPAAKIETELGATVARPFQDADIPRQMNDLTRIVTRADENLRKGYGEAALIYDADERAHASAAAKRAAPPPAGKASGTKKEQAADAAERTGGDTVVGSAPVSKTLGMPEEQRKKQVNARWE